MVWQMPSGHLGEVDLDKALILKYSSDQSEPQTKHIASMWLMSKHSLFLQSAIWSVTFDLSVLGLPLLLDPNSTTANSN